jgi:hypothetical protein
MRNRLTTTTAMFAVVLSALVASLGSGGAGLASPALPTGSGPRSADQVLPDWMPEESAATLDVGIDVLVPLNVPSPFLGVPQINAGGGFYSLYWYVGGGEPTLLQINGTAGGEIPAYSKYDRNVQLEANASVNGYTAYRDLTPIYDLIYWQVGSVVYSVESQNSSVDSLTLANSLVVLAIPGGGAAAPALTGSLASPDQIAAGQVGSVTVSVSGTATLTTDVGYFTATGEAAIAVEGDVTVDWQAPELSEPVTATFSLIDPADGVLITSTPTMVYVEETAADLEWGLECPSQGVAGESVTLVVQGPSRATLSANVGAFSNGSQAMIIDLGEVIEVQFTMPGTESSFARLTLSDGESAVATCEIAAVGEGEIEPTAEATALPDGVFPGDGTDLSIPGGNEPTIPVDFATSTAVPTKPAGELEGDGTGILEAANVTPPVVPPTPTPTKTPKPGEPTSTPVPSNTPVPTDTPTPENPMPTMVPQLGEDGSLAALEIGPEGNTLVSPFGVQIVVPKDTFSDTTSVTVQPVKDAEVPLQPAVRLVPDSAFDISFAQLNGRGIDLGDKKAKVTVDLGDRWADGATLYRLVDGQASELSGVDREGTTLSFDIGGPMRIVAGVPTAQAAAGSRSLVPFIVVALIAVILLIVAISVLTSLRSRRPRAVVTRRASGSRSRF